MTWLVRQSRMACSEWDRSHASGRLAQYRCTRQRVRLSCLCQLLAVAGPIAVHPPPDVFCRVVADRTALAVAVRAGTWPILLFEKSRSYMPDWRGARVVDRGGLENDCKFANSSKNGTFHLESSQYRHSKTAAYLPNPHTFFPVSAGPVLTRLRPLFPFPALRRSPLQRRTRHVGFERLRDWTTTIR